MTAGDLELMKEPVGLIRQYLPDWTAQPEHRELKPGETWCWLTLPAAPGAAYSFRLHEYSNGDRQISAELLGERAKGSHFWYRAFEVAGYKRLKDLKADFLDHVRIIMTCPTQIVQRRGWLFWHFRCEYLEGSDWRSLGSMSALRWQIHVPEIQGNEEVYKSPPVGQGAALNS